MNFCIQIKTIYNRFKRIRRAQSFVMTSMMTASLSVGILDSYYPANTWTLSFRGLSWNCYNYYNSNPQKKEINLAAR